MEYGKRINRIELEHWKSGIISRNGLSDEHLNWSIEHFTKNETERKAEIDRYKKERELLFTKNRNEEVDAYFAISEKLKEIDAEKGINIDNFLDFYNNTDLYNSLTERFGYKIDKTELADLKLFLQNYKYNDATKEKKESYLKDLCYDYFCISNNEGTDKAIKTIKQKIFETQESMKPKSIWEKFKDWLNNRDKVCTDGKDDGKLSSYEKSRYITRGLFGGILKGILKHPIITAVSVLTGFGLNVLTGGAIMPLLWAFGGIASAVTTGVSIYRMSKAKTDGEAKMACETMGNGILGLLLAGITYESTMNYSQSVGIKSAADHSIKNLPKVMIEASKLCIKNTKANFLTWTKGILSPNSNWVKRHMIKTKEIDTEEKINVIIPNKDIPVEYRYEYDSKYDMYYITLKDGKKMYFDFVDNDPTSKNSHITVNYYDRKIKVTKSRSNALNVNTESGYTLKGVMDKDLNFKSIHQDPVTKDLFLLDQQGNNVKFNPYSSYERAYYVNPENGNIKIVIPKNTNTRINSEAESILTGFIEKDLAIRHVHQDPKTHNLFLLDENGNKIFINPYAGYQKAYYINPETGRVKGDLYYSNFIKKDAFMEDGAKADYFRFRSQVPINSDIEPVSVVTVKDLQYIAAEEGTKFIGKDGIEVLESENVLIMDNNGVLSQRSKESMINVIPNEHRNKLCYNFLYGIFNRKKTDNPTIKSNKFSKVA